MSGTTIFTESFETDGNGSRYTTSVPEFSDGSSDFFIRTDGSNVFSDYEVSNPDGSFYFAAMDTDAEPPNQDIISVTWEAIDITGFTNLTFTGLFAEDDEGLNQDWDSNSLVFVEYQIDDNGFQKLIQFAAENRSNTEPGLDTDFDGVRDGAVLTDTFTEFSAAITENGSILDLKLTIANLDAGDEDIAFDLFTIKGDAVSAGNNGSIGDVIWNDLDGDGIFDSNETGINGLTVNLISDTNGNGIIDDGESVLKTATTSGNGDFNFTVLPAGNYIVDVTDTEGILADFSLTQGSAPLAVNLSSDEDFNDADFGYQNTNALLVTNTNDSGTGSLRRAILNANAIAGANTITFDAALAGQTITLTSGELTVTDDLTVQGLGADQLTLSGDDSSRIFNISDDTNNEIEVALDGLSLIDGNTDDDGGAIWNQEKLTLSNSILNSNAAADDGGAIRNDGTLLITDSTLANNASIGSTSTSGGGAILNTTNADTTIENSTLNNNQARNGGAIRNDGLLTVRNSTVSSNTATFSGGGITNSIGVTTVANSTITNNSAPFGGGVYNFSNNGTPATFVVFSTIIADNINDQDIGGEGFISSGNNLIGNGDGGSGFVAGNNDDLVGTTNNPIDPKLDVLANNGGSTATHALLGGSVAIDAGSNLNSLSTDQRGNGFDRSQGARTDIGAFEGEQAQQTAFAVSLGETFTFENFGGIGSTDMPSQTLLDELNTLVFTGTNLTAANLLLTQQGDNLLISFAADNSPQVTLFNFDLQDFDNLMLDSEVVGNIRFEGETAITDSIDVIAAEDTPTAVERANIATFLNDLDNSIVGLNDSNDVINAQGGDDTLNGLTGNDILRGGKGNDTLSGSRGDDTLDGGDDDDLLAGSRGIDLLMGGAGDDILGGGYDADTLTGGSGSDTFRYLILPQSTLADGFDVITDFTIGIGDEADVLNAPDPISAANIIQAGAAAALTEADIQTVLTTANFVRNGAATFTVGERTFVALNDDIAGYQQTTDGLVEITGYSGNLAGLAVAGQLSQATLVGTEGDDFIQSPSENNALSGEGGNDILRGFAGSDTLFGGSGDDSLIGSRGFDLLMGGAGNDILGGGIDADTLTGGSGSDTFRYLILPQSTLANGFDVITDLAIGTGDDADVLNAPEAVSASNLLQAGAISALTEAGIQSVLNITNFTANGAATLTFGDRTFVALNDTVAGYQQATDGLVEITGYSGNLTSLAIAGKLSQDTLVGTDSDDFIQSPSANNALSGEGGNDTLRGNAGSDTLRGGEGDDVLIGSRGFDLLIGGAGNDLLGGGFDADTLTGGSGIDTFRYLVASQSRLGEMDVITDLAIGTDIIDGVNDVDAAAVNQAGTASSLDTAGIQAVLTEATFVTNGAATFRVGERDFLALNDGVAGYQQATDGLVEITGYTGDLANLAIA